MSTYIPIHFGVEIMEMNALEMLEERTTIFDDQTGEPKGRLSDEEIEKVRRELDGRLLFVAIFSDATLKKQSQIRSSLCLPSGRRDVLKRLQDEVQKKIFKYMRDAGYHETAIVIDDR